MRKLLEVWTRNWFAGTSSPLCKISDRASHDAGSHEAGTPSLTFDTCCKGGDVSIEVPAMKTHGPVGTDTRRKDKQWIASTSLVHLLKLSRHFSRG